MSVLKKMEFHGKLQGLIEQNSTNLLLPLIPFVFFIIFNFRYFQWKQISSSSNLLHHNPMFHKIYPPFPPSYYPHWSKLANQQRIVLTHQNEEQQCFSDKNITKQGNGKPSSDISQNSKTPMDSTCVEGFPRSKKQHNSFQYQLHQHSYSQNWYYIIKYSELLQPSPTMSIQTHPFLSSLRKKKSQPPLLAQKKSHLFQKRHSFIREPNSRGNESEQSDQQNQNGNYKEAKVVWTNDQNLKLVALFDRIGANWDEISLQLDGRPPNQVKYHFDALLRKITEKVNKQLREKGKKEIQYKHIKIAIEKSVQDQSLKDDPSSIIRQSISRLISHFLNNTDNNTQENSLDKSIEATQSILMVLKKNRFKKRGSKASTQIYMRSEIDQAHLEEGYMSDSSSAFDEQKEENIQAHQYSKNHEMEFADEQFSMEDYQRAQRGVIIQQSQERIKELLRDSGVLEVEESMPSSKSIKNHESMSSSDNLNNESHQNFYEESQLERQCYWKVSLNNSVN